MEQEHNISNATTAEMMAGDIAPAAVGNQIDETVEQINIEK